MKIAYCRSHEGRDKSSQDRWDAELDRYASAVKQGIQPDGTTMDKILAAEKTSEAHGHAYRGDRADYGLPQLAEIQQAATVGSI